MALCEVLARDPRYAIDVVSTIEKLDEQGFIHVVVRGFELARMEHTFREAADGTLDENCLIVPGSRGLAFLSKCSCRGSSPSRRDRRGSSTASRVVAVLVCGCEGGRSELRTLSV
jgi:hypothetical protein